jgi:hypothetical protein
MVKPQAQEPDMSGENGSGGLFSRKTAAAEQRAHTHGSGAAVADAAVEASPSREHRTIDGDHARPAEPLPDSEKVDHLAAKKAAAEDDTEALIDESVEESFPASDPPSASKFT